MILFNDRASNVLYDVLSNTAQKKFLLPLNVCPIVPDTFLKAKKEFIFIDIDMDTLCMDTDLIKSKLIEDNTIDGLLFVHTFGIDLDMHSFFKEIKNIKENIFIIDDLCPSIQRFDYDIEKSYVDLALFSSGYSKFIDIGYGGYGFVKQERFGKTFMDYSKDKEFCIYKEKIISKIPDMKKHKKLLNSIYEEKIPKELHLGSRFNMWRFSILIDNKEQVLKEIFKEEGLFASSHYPQVDFNYVNNPAKNSNTKKIHDKIVNLFNDFRYDEEKAYKTAEIVSKYAKKDKNEHKKHKGTKISR